MLEKDIRHRPDWLELNSFVSRAGRTSVGENKNALKRDRYITRTVKNKGRPGDKNL